ncbi:MAG TPA: M4 family metallopeptidase [Pyrinomonadaceae bacterium]|jgi:thermolysin|nr:M4 family metallopeptidase [Pyrinomonadaceae bacterium]
MRKLSFNILSAALAVGLGLFTAAPESFGQKTSNRAEAAQLKARSFLVQKGLNVEGLKQRDAIIDAVGSHIRFAQYIDGIRVFGGEIITHERANGKFTDSTDGLFKGAVPSTIPSFGKTEAAGLAQNSFADMTSADTELVYYPQGKELVLAYLVDAKNTDFLTDNPRREMIVINAVTGEEIARWDNLQTSGTTGTGYGFYSGTVGSLPIDLTSGTYSLFDVPNNGKTTDFANKQCPPTGCTAIGTVYTSTDNIFGTNGALSNRESIGVDAHFFAQKVLGYYSTTFGRNGIDNNNNRNLKFGYMVSRTHYGRKYNNAFWDGSSMSYGDGDGSTYRPFDAIDVVGHEMTHGVTERTSNLTYSNESGAANESFSDIFGVIIEFKSGTLTGSGGVQYPADWWIGEDLYFSNNPSSPTTGIRNMANTHATGDPDHYSERYTGTSDSGGVHTNSGIQNYMFYLLVNGGTNHKDTTGTTVSGIGLDAAAAIAYSADTAYCTASDNYAKVANAWVNAAKFRYGAGSTQAQQTYNSWKACGVTPTVAP